MSSISQHISTDFFRENEHHIWCNKHSFQLETTYRTFRRAVPNTEVSLFLYRSHGQSKYAVYHFDSVQDLTLVQLSGVMAVLSDSFSFYGPVSLYLGILFVFSYQGTWEVQLFLSFLIWHFFWVWAKKLIKIFWACRGLLVCDSSLFSVANL